MTLPGGAFRQLTSGGTFIGDLELSGDGSRVYFVSDANLTGQNPSPRRQIFSVDTATGFVRQVTSIPDDSGAGGLSSTFDGTVLAFFSTMEDDADSIGFENIFIAACPAAPALAPGQNVPSLSTMALLALAVVLAGSAIMRLA